MISPIPAGSPADRFPPLHEIPECSALGVPVTVVAAATEAGLIRGVAHFTSPAVIYAEVVRSVGLLAEVADWSQARYHQPSYLGLNGWDVDGGIFLYRWTAETAERWRDPRRRQSERTGQLLYLPHGWVNHTASPPAEVTT